MFTVNCLSDGIYHFNFVKKTDLFLSIMKCQEFYENRSDKIKNKKFTLEDLISVCSESNSNFDFTYWGDYSAFNFPDTIVKSYTKINKDNLSKKEKTVFIEMKK